MEKRSIRTQRAQNNARIVGAETAPVTHCPQCDQRLPAVGEACPRCVPRTAIFKRLGQMLWPYRGKAALMCGLMLVAVVAELAQQLLRTIPRQA